MEVPDRGPRLTLTDLDGAQITTDESFWPALLVFFHTGCDTSRSAAPYLERLYRAYLSAGIRVVAISQDPRRPSKEFSAEVGWTLPVVLDPDGDASRAYEVEWVPSLFWHDRRGRVSSPLVGFDASQYNRLSAKMADTAGVEAIEIVSAKDGELGPRPG